MFEVDCHRSYSKGVLQVTNGIVEADAEMRAFCEHTGELIYWASAIDAQLTKAVIRVLAYGDPHARAYRR